MKNIAIQRKLKRPTKPALVRDTWDWQTLLAEYRESLKTLEAEHLPTLQKYIQQAKQGPETKYLELLELQARVIEAIDIEHKNICFAEQMATDTIDYDTALDILCRAYDAQIIRSVYGYTYVVHSDGELHKTQLKAAIRSVGFQLGVWNERLKDSETFFMTCPFDRLSILSYIENLSDDDDE